MIVHKDTQVLITVEMTEEQSQNLCVGLQKSANIVSNAPSIRHALELDEKEKEVLDDLRQSILNA